LEGAEKAIFFANSGDPDMTPRLSTRISLRWLPDPPSEPTDTLVMSVGDYYMDLCVTKTDTSIDWAMAGQRLILSEEPRQYTEVPLLPA
jgi:hypothetical protein